MSATNETNKNSKFIKITESKLQKQIYEKKMGDVSPSNSTEDEIVKFTVIRTSDAARKEVSSIDFHIEMNGMCVYMVSLRVRE